jgi:hypothetical protein
MAAPIWGDPQITISGTASIPNSATAQVMISCGHLYEEIFGIMNQLPGKRLTRFFTTLQFDFQTVTIAFSNHFNFLPVSL